MTTMPLADRTTAVAARATDLSKIYGQGETQVVALDDVTVEFAGGAFTAIMGPSGSGKSTLMHCVAGLDSFSSGSVRVGDIELGSLTDRQLTKLRRDKVGFIFQAFNLLPTLTALENITLPMDIAGRAPDKEWLDSVIQMVGLSGRLTHRPAQLSGGQQLGVPPQALKTPNTWPSPKACPPQPTYSRGSRRWCSPPPSRCRSTRRCAPSSRSARRSRPG